MHPWSPLLAVLGLAGCAAPVAATRPAAPPPDLAALVAPGPVRPEMAAPLTALLRGDHADMLFTLGDETVRCSLDIAPARAAATCDGVVEGAATVAALAQILHTGDWQRRRQLAHLGDQATFHERTALDLINPDTLRERNPFGPAETVHALSEPIGWTRFEVSERGETVRAFFTSIEGPETIEAGSLLALGQRLRERQAELIAEQGRRAIQERDRVDLGFLLDHASETPEERWQLDSVVVGQARLGQLASLDTRLRLRTPEDPFWRGNSNALALATERAPGASPVTSLPLGRVVVQASLFGDRETPGETYCARHDEWLTRQRTPFTRREAPTPTGCRWSWSNASYRLDLELTATQRRLSVTWQPDRFDQTAHTMIALEHHDRPVKPGKRPWYIDP